MIVTLICETAGCENAGYEIKIENPAEICICGVCGNLITNKR